MASNRSDTASQLSDTLRRSGCCGRKGQLATCSATPHKPPTKAAQLWLPAAAGPPGVVSAIKNTSDDEIASAMP